LRIGRSVHEAGEVVALAAEGAVDYVVFGPVFETPSKRGLLEPRGLAGLATACRAGLPVIAIGGIDASNAGSALAAGAAGVAAIRACADRRTARELVEAARAEAPA
jgi:thiamine-phosphate pyrophosphorylase